MNTSGGFFSLAQSPQGARSRKTLAGHNSKRHVATEIAPVAQGARKEKAAARLTLRLLMFALISDDC
jgi:hypothetical protein